MRIRLVAVGRLRAGAHKSLVDDYVERIRHAARCEIEELRDDRELVRAWPKADTVVALEVRGKAYSSREFSVRLANWGLRGKGEIAFVIGGAEGILPELSARADELLSLSRMTLPHRLARVLLLEQIYRGLTILRHEPYARED